MTKREQDPEIAELLGRPEFEELRREAEEIDADPFDYAMSFYKLAILTA